MYTVKKCLQININYTCLLSTEINNDDLMVLILINLCFRLNQSTVLIPQKQFLILLQPFRLVEEILLKCKITRQRV